MGFLATHYRGPCPRPSLDAGFAPDAAAREAGRREWIEARIFYEGFSLGDRVPNDGASGSVLGMDGGLSEFVGGEDGAFPYPQPDRSLASGWSAGATYEAEDWSVGISFARSRCGSSDWKIIRLDF